MMMQIKYPKVAFVIAFVVTFVVLGLLKDWIVNAQNEPKVITGDFSALLIDEQPTIYHSPQCNVCLQLVAYLDEQNIAYSKKNIDQSAEYKREFQRLNINTIPLIITKSYAIVGFHKNEVDKLFNKNNKAS